MNKTSYYTIALCENLLLYKKMIKHTKFTKSNIPIALKSNPKKQSKKILSSCGTPLNIFSKPTSRTGSPYPATSKSLKRLPSKIKSSATTTRLKLDSIQSYTSPINPSNKLKKNKKSLKVKAFSTNLSPKSSDLNENFFTCHHSKETLDIKDKSIRKIDQSTVNQLRQILQKVLLENSNLKKKLKYLSESQEEPKSIMNSHTVEAAIEEIKNKLKGLKQKYM